MTDEKTIEEAKKLIAIASTSDKQSALHEAVEFMTAMLRDYPDITIERFESNGKPSFLAYKGPQRPDKFAVLFHAHVDVVPSSPDQLIPRIENGRLYGRGSHDMKTAAIVMTDIFRRMAPSVPYTFGLQIVSDEEVGGYDGAYYQVQHEGIRAEFVVTGEHNFKENALYNASRGICWTEIAFKGRTAHGAYVWKGSNAVMKASDFAQEVLRRYPAPKEELWGTTANIAGIHTENTAYNRIPDNAILKIDFRFTAEDPTFRSREAVAAFVHSIDPDAEIIDFVTMEQAVHVSEHNPYLQTLAAALEKTINKAPIFESRPAGSDGRHYATVNNDVVEYGITGSGPHSDEEYIELGAIAPYRKTLEVFLANVPKVVGLSTHPMHDTTAPQPYKHRDISAQTATVNS